MKRHNKCFWLGVLVTISIALALGLVGSALTTIFYKVQPVQVQEVVKDYEREYRLRMKYYQDKDGKWQPIDKEARRDGKN